MQALILQSIISRKKTKTQLLIIDTISLIQNMSAQLQIFSQNNYSDQTLSLSDRLAKISHWLENGLEWGGGRSSLISEAIRIIDIARPDVFIWENVKGAFSSNDSEDFWGIIQAFAHIGGYSIEWQLLNSAWVLPQNRERIYLVGHLAGRSRLGVFPITESDKRDNERESNSSIVRTLTAGAKSGGHHSGMTLIKENTSLLYWKGSKDKWVNENKEITPTLKCQQDNNRSTMIVTKAHGFAKSIQTETCPTIRANSFEQNNHVFINQINSKQNFGNSTKQQDRVYGTNGIMACLGSNRTDDKTKILVAQRGGRNENDPQKLEQRKDENTNTLTSAAKDNMIAEGSTIRRLTEIECERLQGFPDDWTRYGIFDKWIWHDKKLKTKQLIEEVAEVAKTNRYKMCGNAVNVATFTQVAKRLKDCIIW